MKTLRLSKLQCRRLSNAMEDAISDREEFIRCNQEPFRYLKMDSETKSLIRRTERQIEFCKLIQRQLGYGNN